MKNLSEKLLALTDEYPIKPGLMDQLLSRISYMQQAGKRALAAQAAMLGQLIRLHYEKGAEVNPYLDITKEWCRFNRDRLGELV